MSGTNKRQLSISDKKEFITLSNKLSTILHNKIDKVAFEDTNRYLMDAVLKDNDAYKYANLPSTILTLNTAILFAEEINPDPSIIIAILLYPLLKYELSDIIYIRQKWGEDIAGILTSLSEADKYSNKNNRINNDNFRGLLVSLADDIRVIMIMIVRNLAVMRMLNDHQDEELVRNIAFEANYLYAQLAHRLGLYKIKSELEDLALKYTNREIYTQIANKLNSSKQERDQYIKSFITPLKNKLKNAGVKFEIKGRTKSISSIWNKMKKQKVDVSGIYDLFAIRVIIDTEPEKEKAQCWLAYSILADMYTANPARMRDWITIPKSNGYESLHATVLGPDSKWVEVQFRTKRMDLVAEKGLAAHWRYKGVKSDSTDQWMNNIRDILESAEADSMHLMKEMKMDSLEKEVFAFTPKGDLFKLAAGATVLDFAFLIHSDVGTHCTGAIVNGRNKKITYKIQNGDTLEILTSSTQTPKPDWVNIVVTTKARNKIKQSLNEELLRRAQIGKELLERRAKNRKIEIDEASLMKFITKKGYKFVNEFFADIADEKLDVNKFLASYNDETLNIHHEILKTSAEEFQLQQDENNLKEDVITIGDKNISGINYKFARCCSPIYGDDVFGFISSDGTIKIHRSDCPNALNIKNRYPYRLIKADWSGKEGELLPVTLKILGNDDIGILANITSIISKELGVNMRNITVNSLDGIFQGVLVVSVSDSKKLNLLIKKIKTVKGVKEVQRI